jgi:hypothetical protein
LAENIDIFLMILDYETVAIPYNEAIKIKGIKIIDSENEEEKVDIEIEGEE